MWKTGSFVEAQIFFMSLIHMVFSFSSFFPWKYGRCLDQFWPPKKKVLFLIFRGELRIRSTPFPLQRVLLTNPEGFRHGIQMRFTGEDLPSFFIFLQKSRATRLLIFSIPWMLAVIISVGFLGEIMCRK